MYRPDPKLLHAFELMQSGREAEGIILFRQLAERNDQAALATLAELNWQEDGPIPQDLAAGYTLYSRAAEAGHAGCGVYFTNLLANGMAGPGDFPSAIERLWQEAKTERERWGIADLLSQMNITRGGDPIALPEEIRLNESPRISVYREAFTNAECDYLLALGEPGFGRAQVIDADTGKQKLDPIRTADAAHVHWRDEDPAVHAMNRRLAALSGTKVEQGEPLQILRYRPGQEYRTHVDYIRGVANQRTTTALLYLSSDYDGGETFFPRIGLAVKGRKGDVLVFSNVAPDGGCEWLAEHAGLPVTSGTKYLASRWIRARRHWPDGVPNPFETSPG